MFTALGILSDDEDINRVWENIKENMKTSAKGSLGLHELKKQNTWFDKECLGFLYKRKQAKLHWVQDPRQRNVDNLNNVRREASRHCRSRKERHILNLK
jgi:hypothetical protein